MNYGDLISKINENSEIKVEYRGLGIGMVNHHYPISITQAEFNFITKTIKENKLKKGYEVATAFGISALSAGLGFKETGGKLVTMDAYIEEQYNNCGAYIDRMPAVYKNADGYRLAQNIREIYRTPVYLEVGWSPNDTKSCLDKYFDLEKDKLDYVFVDAAHWDSATIMDISSILPYLSNKYVIFLHDSNGFQDGMVKFCQEKFGKTWTVAITDKNIPHYNLAYISNII